MCVCVCVRVMVMVVLVVRGKRRLKQAGHEHRAGGGDAGVGAARGQAAERDSRRSAKAARAAASLGRAGGMLRGLRTAGCRAALVATAYKPGGCRVAGLPSLPCLLSEEQRAKQVCLPRCTRAPLHPLTRPRALLVSGDGQVQRVALRQRLCLVHCRRHMQAGRNRLLSRGPGKQAQGSGCVAATMPGVTQAERGRQLGVDARVAEGEDGGGWRWG